MTLPHRNPRELSDGVPPHRARGRARLRAQSRAQLAGVSDSMGRRLYVGNLPYSATEDQLTELFSRAGKVDNVRVMRDMATGRARGFAFVEMGTDEEAQKAITEFHEQQMDGRALVVNEARSEARRRLWRRWRRPWRRRLRRRWRWRRPRLRRWRLLRRTAQGTALVSSQRSSTVLNGKGVGVHGGRAGPLPSPPALSLSGCVCTLFLHDPAVTQLDDPAAVRRRSPPSA